MRVILVIIIGAILGYVLFHSVRLFLLVHISGQLAKNSMRFEQLIESGTPSILLVGDSLGVGTGSDPAQSVAGRFGAEFPKAHIRNASVNGAKVADAIRNFPAVPEKSADVVLLMIGANDILQRTPMPEFAASLDQLFKTSAAAGKNVYALHSGNIGLAPFFPWPLSSFMSSRTRAYRAEYMRIAKENNVTYIDLYGEKGNDPFKGNREFYADDLLHLSGLGYGEWYKKIRATMNEAL